MISDLVFGATCPTGVAVVRTVDAVASAGERSIKGSDSVTPVAHCPIPRQGGGSRISVTLEPLCFMLPPLKPSKINSFPNTPHPNYPVFVFKSVFKKSFIPQKIHKNLKPL